MIELVIPAQITGDAVHIAGARMAARQQLAAEGGILGKTGALQLFKVDRRLMVVELPDQVVAMGNRGPAEEWVR